MRPAYTLPAGLTHHEFVRRDDGTRGYEEKEYEHREYPKQVGDVIVANAEEEATLLPAKEEKPEAE